jgi:hypothetical protein
MSCDHDARVLGRRPSLRPITETDRASGLHRHRSVTRSSQQSGKIGAMTEQRWTIDELRRELARFERELRAAGLRDSSVQTYVDRSGRFINWLAGEYQPRGPVGR